MDDLDIATGFQMYDFENENSDTANETGLSDNEEVSDGSVSDTPSDRGTDNAIYYPSTNELLINGESFSGSGTYEDYMDIEFFTGESFPAILPSFIIAGFGLFTIMFLIGFGIFKVVSLLNINNNKED